MLMYETTHAYATISAVLNHLDCNVAYHPMTECNL